MNRLTTERGQETAFSGSLPLQTIDEYDLAIRRLNALLADIDSPAAAIAYAELDHLTGQIQTFEETLVPIPEQHRADMLRFFMREHGLGESDLPEIGPPELVGEILSGRRRLNARQIHALGRRFRVAPAVFI